MSLLMPESIDRWPGRFKTYRTDPDYGSELYPEGMQWMIDFQEQKLYSETKSGFLHEGPTKSEGFEEMRETLDWALTSANAPSGMRKGAMTADVCEQMLNDIERAEQYFNQRDFE